MKKPLPVPLPPESNANTSANRNRNRAPGQRIDGVFAQRLANKTVVPPATPAAPATSATPAAGGTAATTATGANPADGELPEPIRLQMELFQRNLMNFKLQAPDPWED